VCRFWQFKTSRRWDPSGARQQAAGAAAAAPEGSQARSEDPETIRSQLAGLRHRAAIRATTKRRAQPDGADAAPEREGAQAQEQQQQAQAQAREESWDSSEVADGAQVGGGAAAAAGGPKASAARRFVASEEKRGQVIDQLAGLKRRAAIKQQPAA
jgi:hypothetical protein